MGDLAGVFLNGTDFKIKFFSMEETHDKKDKCNFICDCTDDIDIDT